MILFLCTLQAWANDPIVLAAKQELQRNLENLSLPEQPKPHAITYHLIDEQTNSAFSQLGMITSENMRTYRTARIEVRVGDKQFDNTNFSGTIGSQNGIKLQSLTTDQNPLSIKRSLWLATDNAFKGAAQEYSAKVAALDGVLPEKQPDMLDAPIIQETIMAGKAAPIEVKEWARFLTSTPVSAAQIEEFTAVANQTTTRHTIITSEGITLQFPESRIVLRVEAIARAKDGATIRNTRSWVVKRADLLPQKEQIANEIKTMLAWIEKLKTAPVEEDYLGPVFFEPQAAVELFRQLLPREISANPPESEPPDEFGELRVPVASSRKGRRLLPEGWSVVDDAQRYPDLLGSYKYDYEGVEAKRVDLIQNGVVVNLLMSRIPRKGFTESTGHGRSLGRARRIPMQSVVEVSPPKRKSLRKIKRKAFSLAKQAGKDYIIVIRKITSLALNQDFEITFSGDGPLSGLTAPLEAVRLYKDGREEPIRGIQFVGVDKRVLRDIIFAGQQSTWTDLTDDTPNASRYSIGVDGGLNTSWSVPAVLISEMEIKGQGGKENRIIPTPE